jgi:mannan endo-1,4-beta-mannosidase
VEGFDTATDSIKFRVNVASTNLYDLNIVYNGPYGDKYTSIVLNGAGGSQVSLPATTSWTSTPGGQVLLETGLNTIEIQNNWGWYLIDAITLSPSAKRSPHRITPTPVNPNANADANALLKYLGNIYGKNILSGQQDEASLEWVTSNVGKTPAILGVDFMDYTDSRTSRGASSTDVDKAIAFAQKGGIVTFCWHWVSKTLEQTPHMRHMLIGSSFCRVHQSDYTITIPNHGGQASTQLRRTSMSRPRLLILPMPITLF